MAFECVVAGLHRRERRPVIVRMNFNNTAVPYRPYQQFSVRRDHGLSCGDPLIHRDIQIWTTDHTNLGDPSPTSVLTHFTQKKKTQKRVRFCETVSFLLSISPRRRRRMSQDWKKRVEVAEWHFPPVRDCLQTIIASSRIRSKRIEDTLHTYREEIIISGRATTLSEL